VRALQLHIDGNLFSSFGGETYADIERLYPLTVHYVPFIQREHNNGCTSTESSNVFGKLCGACYLASGTVGAAYLILQLNYL
jgi:hypothetical protein